MSAQFAVATWEEVASDMPRAIPDTDRLMAAVYHRFEIEGVEITDIGVIANDYFRRARWPHPTNLPATANYCASKGWLSEAGQENRIKLWRITKKGYNYIKSQIASWEGK